MEPIHLTPAPEDAGTRIDCFLASHLDGVTRSAAQKLLEGGAVQVNGKAVAKNYKLTGRETLSVTLPEAEEADLIPQDIPLDVVYEDADVIVVNKPSGLVVHPAPGHSDGPTCSSPPSWPTTLSRAPMKPSAPEISATMRAQWTPPSAATPQIEKK